MGEREHTFIFFGARVGPYYWCTTVKPFNLVTDSVMYDPNVDLP